MDSGNSGSMNSSSGGDDQEYDSRATTAESISALFNPALPTQIQNPIDPSFNFDDLPNFFTNSFVNTNATASGWSDPDRHAFNPSPPLPAPFNDQTTKATRNPKKRPRASRRAPTTVLTTDTTNFRAMVQEFTGIPASPFMTSSVPFFRTKLVDDFLRAPSSIRSNLSPTSTNYQLLKPFPQKLQQPPPFLSSSSFQSLLQSDPKNNNSLPGSKSLEVECNDTSILKKGFLNEFGFSPTQTVLPDIGFSGGGDYGSSQGFSDGRLSFLGSPSSSLPNYHTGKESENVVAARGEGMMESWICSSE